MVSLCPLVSRLSLATRTSATAARILKGKIVPALLNRGVEANQVIETHSFSVKSYFDGDDCGCGAGNKENNASVHPAMRISVNSKILEVPSGILPSSVSESDKEAIYRLHMEDQEVYTPKRLAKDYNTAAEMVDEILLLRDALTNRRPEHTERAAMYRMYKENPEIYTIERLAKDFKIARGTAHLTLFAEHVRETILQPKSSTSDGQEIPSLPFTRFMKDTWAELSANNNAFDRYRKASDDLMKKYKKQLPPESLDDEVHKLFYSQVVSDSTKE
ncbi:hypothetical protein Q3G72_013511 [Acer saccharum]|nr:hypothetical protein Q3G72_013511 [Acer saccharum]